MSRGTSAQNANLGVLIRPKKDVRQKKTSEYFWSNITTNQKVAMGDSIFTGEKSSAIVQLNDGRKIFLSENSMVKLKKNKSQTSIEIPFGEVQAENFTSEMSITECGQNIILKGKDAKFKISKGKDCGSLSFDVTAGELTVDSVKATKAAGSKSGFKLKTQIQVADVVDIVPPVEVAPPTVEVPAVKPAPPTFANNKFRYYFGSPQDFNAYIVNADPEVKNYIIETSTDPNFTSPIVSNVAVPQIVLNNEYLDLQKKTYARVKSVSKNLIESDYSDVVQVTTIYPKFKINSELLVKDYKAKNSRDNGVVENFKVDWSSVPKADQYVVEASEVGNENNKITIKSRRPASVLPISKVGEYTYKVKALDRSGREISTSENTGKILYNKIFNLVAPRFDVEQADINYFFQKGMGRLIRLKWESDYTSNSASESAEFTVDISKDNQFQTVVQQYKTARQSLVVRTNLDQGLYFWRVKMESDGQSSDWSNIGQFNILTNSTIHAEEEKK